MKGEGVSKGGEWGRQKKKAGGKGGWWNVNKKAEGGAGRKNKMYGCGRRSYEVSSLLKLLVTSEKRKLKGVFLWPITIVGGEM